MEQFSYNDLIIDVSDDNAWSLGAAGNLHTYSRHYFGAEGEEYPVSKVAIQLLKDSLEVRSCIIIASGGATCVGSDTVVLDGDRLVLCCGNTVFCLAIPTLQLIWQTKADWATCFGIYKVRDGYITHGEVSVARLDNTGAITWVFDTCDILVSLDGHQNFTLLNDHIHLSDINKAEYTLDFNGKLIS